MKSCFAKKIDGRGRLARGVLGGLLVLGGVMACSYSFWPCLILEISGGFVLFEAARGWCVMRACGIKTKLQFNQLTGIRIRSKIGYSSRNVFEWMAPIFCSVAW
jgi:hypothetical protein